MQVREFGWNFIDSNIYWPYFCSRGFYSAAPSALNIAVKLLLLYHLEIHNASCILSHPIHPLMYYSPCFVSLAIEAIDPIVLLLGDKQYDT